MDYELDGPEQEDVEPQPEIIKYPDPEPEVGEEPGYEPGTWIVE